MALVLLPAAWLACLLLFRELSARGRIAADWRIAFLLAGAAWAALLTLGTELLSLATALTSPCVTVFWLITNAGLWGGLIYWRRRSPAAFTTWTFSGEWRRVRVWPWDAQLMLGVALLFAAFLGGIALFTPTTNWDSLTYHLARVMHWMQQRSVAHFPTNMPGQIQMGPWSEFVQLHLWLLTGGDRFANLVQWFAMVGCTVVATLLLRQMLAMKEGDSPSPCPSPPMGERVSRAATSRVEAFAVLLVVTLPTGIVQSISTQTDYVTAFWYVSLTSLALAWWREPANRVYALGFGAVLGLGVLTKLTFVIYAGPVGIATALALLLKTRREWAQLLRPAIISLAICLAICLPHLARNRAVYGSVVGSQAHQAGHAVPRPTVSRVMSNLIRNVQLHLNTGNESLTHALNKTADTMQSWTGVAADDRDLSSYAGMFEPPDEFFVFDSFAASPWHLLLIIAAVVVGLVSLRKDWLPLSVLGLAFTGLLLLCMAVKWQIWNSRYHLPLFVLCAPATAVLLVPRLPRWLSGIVATGLVCFGVVIVANNRSRPIFDPAWRAQPRMQKIFSFMGQKFYEPTLAVAARIVAANCHEVGLKLSPDDPEYPLWLMLHEAGFRGEVHHVLVDGPSAQLPAPTKETDVIVTTLAMHPTGDMAVAFPKETDIGPKDGPPVFRLFWSAKISQERTHAGK